MYRHVRSLVTCNWICSSYSYHDCDCNRPLVIESPFFKSCSLETPVYMIRGISQLSNVRNHKSHGSPHGNQMCTRLHTWNGQFWGYRNAQRSEVVLLSAGEGWNPSRGQGAVAPSTNLLPQWRSPPEYRRLYKTSLLGKMSLQYLCKWLHAIPAPVSIGSGLALACTM